MVSVPALLIEFNGSLVCLKNRLICEFLSRIYPVLHFLSSWSCQLASTTWQQKMEQCRKSLKLWDKLVLPMNLEFDLVKEARIPIQLVQLVGRLSWHLIVVHFISFAWGERQFCNVKSDELSEKEGQCNFCCSSVHRCCPILIAIPEIKFALGFADWAYTSTTPSHAAPCEAGLLSKTHLNDSVQGGQELANSPHKIIIEDYFFFEKKPPVQVIGAGWNSACVECNGIGIYRTSSTFCSGK
jgi:hypothetical protein